MRSGIAVGLFLVLSPLVQAAGLEAGAATVDITPPTGYPMWGYAARKDAACVGILDPLYAKALVLVVGERKLAFVSLDLGRAPTRDSMARIRQDLSKAGVTELFVVASHTHHGPVIELDTWPKMGKPYVRDLEEKIADVVKKADASRKPAKYGVASGETPLNRNRQSKLPNPPVDRELLVLRIEDMAGKPIAHAVNFAAHPTMTPTGTLKFSADFPGAMAKKVEAATGAPCLFLQGACGDLSPNPPEAIRSPTEFGERLAESVLKLVGTLKCEPRDSHTLRTQREEFRFAIQVDPNNAFARLALERAFFPELIGFFRREYADGVRPTLTLALLDGSVGFVGASGEFFCEHALSLKRRSRLEHTFFLGYCNDYQQYFPTIPASAEGGYGTNAPVASAELGAGERMMDRAVIELYRMRGKLAELK
jgi:neutral ceramidase